MADLALNERLQPALLDRLTDDERTVALVVVTWPLSGGPRAAAAAERQALIDILSSAGHDAAQRQGVKRATIFWNCDSRLPEYHANPSQLRALVLRPPGCRPKGIAATVLFNSAIRVGAECRAGAGRPADIVDAPPA